ncbi:UNVERIFIED_CONTAM: putative ubiquitin-like-specific protease 2B [Sesamum indicum]
MESEVTYEGRFSEDEPSDIQTKISSLSSGVHENHDKGSAETKNQDKNNDGNFRKRSFNKGLIPYARRRRKSKQGSDSSDWEVASASFHSRTESRRLMRVSSVLREPLRDNLFDHCFRLESNSRTPCMLLLDSLHTLGPLRLEPLLRRFVLDIYETEDRPECKDMVQNIPLLVPQVPQQRNGEECGIFVLYYTNLFLENAPENFSVSEGYPYFVSKIVPQFLSIILEAKHNTLRPMPPLKSWQDKKSVSDLLLLVTLDIPSYVVHGIPAFANFLLSGR